MTSANVTNTSVVPEATKTAPYYNDYDEAKNFLQLVFRPGYAVQARELTQIQTLGQVQLERLSRHLFKNGSIVIGGQISYDIATTINLASQYAGVDVDVSDFIGKKIVYSSGNTTVVAQVITGENATTDDPPILMIKYLTGVEFANSTTIRVQGENVYANISSNINFSTIGQTASVSDGIFFINGWYVRAPSQTIVLSKYNTRANAKVGLEYSDEIITESEDTSLLDPASEASNYQAPGAARFKIDLTLAKRNVANTVDETQFIELLRIEDGISKAITKVPIYSEIEETFARRTYDESGSYTVRPFRIQMKDDPANTSNMVVRLDPGKAYPFGYEFETISPTDITVERPRANANVTGLDIVTAYGNYVIVGNANGNFDLTTMPMVYLHSVPYGAIDNSNTATHNATKVGTARLRHLEYEDSTNTANGLTHTYKAYLFDTRFSSMNVSILSSTANSINLWNASANWVLSGNTSAYDGVFVQITQGPGIGEILKVSSFDPTTKNLRFTSSFITQPTSASVASINFSFKDVESIIITTAGGGNALTTANANITVDSKIGANQTGDTQLSETGYNQMYFKLPHRYLKDKTGLNNYMYRKALGTITFTAGVSTTIVPDSGEAFFGNDNASQSDSVKRLHYLAIVRTVSSGANTKVGQPLAFDSPREVNLSGGNLVLDAKLPGDTFTADIFADTNINSGNKILPKAKTLVVANTNNMGYTLSGGPFIIGRRGTGGSWSNTNTSIYLAHGQVWITNPNKNPALTDSLFISDVRRVNAIYDLNGTSPSANAALSSYNDVKTSFIFDDGQRDNFYDHATIRIRPGITPPKGPLVVCVDYYTHGIIGGGTANGFFSLESYPNITTNEGYGDVPSFDPDADDVLSLRDVIDFRPKRQNASNTEPNFVLENIRIPVPNQSFEVNYDYYLPRRDLVVLGKDRQFRVIKGEASLNPAPPNDPDNAMILYRLYNNPYVITPEVDVVPKYVENKRYTMRDIGALETRITNMEYYTALTFLEKDANEVVIRDSFGLERTKYGILVDSFEGHQIGDVTNIDYNCSMDFTTGVLRPGNRKFDTQLNYTTADSNARRNGSTITMNYTEVDFLVQNTASKAENVNFYLIGNFIGTVEMSPDGDNWVDTNTKPDVVVNLNGSNDAWQKVADVLGDSKVYETEWSDWETHWFGKSTDSKFLNSATGQVAEHQNDIAINSNQTGAILQQTTTTTSGTKTRTGLKPVLKTEAIKEDLGDKVINAAIIPYIRYKAVNFFGYGLRPTRQVWYYFDDTPVSNYVQRPNIIKLNGTPSFLDIEGYNELISKGSNTAIVLSARPDEVTGNTVLYVANVKGYFDTGTITGMSSGNTATVSSYEHFSGIASGGNTTTITLQVGASSVESWFVGNVISIVHGPGVGQNSTITAYNASTRNVTVSPAFTTAISSNSKYSIGKHYTSYEGQIVGQFHIPANSDLRFRTGDRNFRIIDTDDNDLDNITTRADGRYTAQGLRQTVQGTVISTTVPKIKYKSITQTNDVSKTVTKNKIVSTFQSVQTGDPLAQTFFVDEDLYPNGVFISSVEVFFKSKSTTLPVWVQLRPTVNGYPHSSTIYPYSYKVLYPNQVNISDNPSVANTSTATKFVFSNPVYLTPGEHALIVQSDSLDYETYISELGKKKINSDEVISEQPILGSLFKSQNASTWSAFQFEDLMFKLNKCQFTVGTASIFFENEIPEQNHPYDFMYPHTNVMLLPGTKVTHAFKSTDAANTVDTVWRTFIENNNFTFPFDGRRVLFNTHPTINVRATIETTDEDISPAVDISRYGILAVENIINNANLTNSTIVIANGGYDFAHSNIIVTISGNGNPYGTTANAYVSNVFSNTIQTITVDSGGSYYVDRATITITSNNTPSINATVNVASELDPTGGPALSKYITRKVVLKDGFDAGDLRVYLTAYMPTSTQLEVYYKIMNREDPDKFENKSWNRMVRNETVDRRSRNEDDLIELEYFPSVSSNTITYQAGTTVYNSFNQFAIKIVMLSDYYCTVPYLTDMRAIALPGTT